MIFGREPALIAGVIHAVIALAVGFGLDITTEQLALIEAAVAALLAVVVRQQVTPVATVDERGQTVNGVLWAVVLLLGAVLLVLLIAERV